MLYSVSRVIKQSVCTFLLVPVPWVREVMSPVQKVEKWWQQVLYVLGVHVVPELHQMVKKSYNLQKRYVQAYYNNNRTARSTKEVNFIDNNT